MTKVDKRVYSEYVNQNSTDSGESKVNNKDLQEFSNHLTKIIEKKKVSLPEIIDIVSEWHDIDQEAKKAILKKCKGGIV